MKSTSKGTGRASRHGITRDDRGQDQPTDKRRAQQATTTRKAKRPSPSRDSRRSPR